jgi:hypothetical protein
VRKFFLVFGIGVVLTGACFALDFTHGPDALQPKDILINGAFDVGNASIASSSGILFGFTGGVDYVLPKFGLTIGGETGYSGSSVDGDRFGVIPIMARLGYHPDFGVNNLDVYAMLKLGMGIGFALNNNRVGFGIGFNLGTRYFFTPHIGVFGELGYNGHHFRMKGSSVRGSEFFTVGVTYKL